MPALAPLPRQTGACQATLGRLLGGVLLVLTYVVWDYQMEDGMGRFVIVVLAFPVS
jgi:hypothetical protein